MDCAILGGGIAGLSAALAVARTGADVQVYERRSSVHGLGAGIVCWPNATFVFSEFGILDDVLRVSGTVSAMKRMSANGEELGRLDIRRLDAELGHPSLSILRSDLMRILLNKVQDLGVPVHFGACADNILPVAQNKGTVTFSNGSSVKADIILGADGRMNSTARTFVSGDNKPVFQGFANWIGVFKSSNSIFTDRSIQDYWGVGKRFGIVPVADQMAYWAAGIAEPNQVSINREFRSGLNAAFCQWPEPIGRILAQVTNENTRKILLYDHEPIPNWHRHNVLLIGDAAHAALQTSGQGAAQALEDAWLLARLFESKLDCLNDVMRTFAQIRIGKTKGITDGARKLARSLFNPDSDFCAQRDARARQTDYDEMAIGMAKAWSAGLPIGG